MSLRLPPYASKVTQSRDLGQAWDRRGLLGLLKIAELHKKTECQMLAQEA